MKTGHRVYFHITILVNRSVQLVARNHECLKGLNNVPCVIWSCIKMHATHEMRELRIEVNHSCNKLHVTHEIRELQHIEVNHSCNKLHVTHEIVNYTSRLIIRATNCTLRGRTPYASRMVFIVRLWVAIIKVR